MRLLLVNTFVNSDPATPVSSMILPSLNVVRTKLNAPQTKRTFKSHGKNLKASGVLYKYVIHTTVSRLLAAVPVHLPMILSMHFLWMAALHSDKEAKMKETSHLDLIIYFLDSEVMLLIIKG